MKTRGILAELGIPWAFAWLSRSKHREDRPEGQNSLVLWCFTLPEPASPNFPSFACCFAATTGCDCKEFTKQRSALWSKGAQKTIRSAWCTDVYGVTVSFFSGVSMHRGGRRSSLMRAHLRWDSSRATSRNLMSCSCFMACQVGRWFRFSLVLVMIQTWSLVTLDDWKCLAHYGSLVPLQILQLSLQRLDFNLSPLYTLAEQLEQMDFCSPCSQANQNPIPSGFLHGFHKAIVWILFQFFLSPKCQVTCGICCTGATLRSDLGGHVFPVPDEVGGLSIGQLRSGVFGTNIGCCMVQIPCYWLS